MACYFSRQVHPQSLISETARSGPTFQYDLIISGSHVDLTVVIDVETKIARLLILEGNLTRILIEDSGRLIKQFKDWRNYGWGMYNLSPHLHTPSIFYV